MCTLTEKACFWLRFLFRKLAAPVVPSGGLCDILRAGTARFGAPGAPHGQESGSTRGAFLTGSAGSLQPFPGGDHKQLFVVS